MKVEQKCGIISRTVLNDAAISLTLEVGDMVRTAFRAPGQFVHIKCGHSRLLRRPISVCACQAGEGDAPDRLTVVFEVRGEGTAWLAGRREGQSLDVMGLLGNGFPIEREGRYLLVGGGIGVPPMLGCAQYAPGRCTAILGFRSGDRVMLEEQFRSVCSQVQVATDDGSYGFHGYVDALVRRPPTHAEKRGPGGGGLRRALPGVHGGADGLRRRRLPGLCLRHGGRQPETCVQGRTRL